MAWCVSSSHPCGSTMASEPCLFTNVFSGVSDIVAVSFSTSFNSNTNAVSCIFCSFPILWIPFSLLSFSMSVSQRGCWFLVEKITLLNSLSLLLNLFKWGEQLGGKFPICINALAVNTSVKPLPKRARGGQTLTLGWPVQSGGQASFGGTVRGAPLWPSFTAPWCWCHAMQLCNIMDRVHAPPGDTGLKRSWHSSQLCCQYTWTLTTLPYGWIAMHVGNLPT